MYYRHDEACIIAFIAPFIRYTINTVTIYILMKKGGWGCKISKMMNLLMEDSYNNETCVLWLRK
jgi:hypothetical protein